MSIRSALLVVCISVVLYFWLNKFSKKENYFQVRLKRNFVSNNNIMSRFVSNNSDTSFVKNSRPIFAPESRKLDTTRGKVIKPGPIRQVPNNYRKNLANQQRQVRKKEADYRRRTREIR